ncbi:FtsX-like permease family protein [Hyphomicrobium sp. NDB2Meth4]|uniref:ABC transporter permease n=1 Tax=Hyphomicrobium sp. NDB2Meth4 TaxID=1892846 RepID=UPI0009308DA7|nr:FtsX-like permease family protein [Hyphomicrobium sp. NDB2Meth4]
MTAADTLNSSPNAGQVRLPLILSIAARELRAGFSGFRIFIACVALGVMVIASVGAVSDALRGGFERQGEAILGGDATLARTHVKADEDERAIIDTFGRVSETGTMRTMARRPDASDQALAELKAVDDAYPLVGKVEIADGIDLKDALAKGAVVDPALLERLKLKVGDEMGLGDARVKVGGALKSEPDGITDRLTYGPRVLISEATLEKTGLIKPGTLVRWRYAVKLGDAAASDSELLALRNRIDSELPDSGFTVADRRDPSPQVTRTLERLRQFLTLVGLTSLLVGGVGIANAVATFIDRRRKVIATMKSIGATSRMVLGIFLAEVLAVAAVGVGIGLALGMLAPFVLDWLFGDLLPIAAEMTVTPLSIVTALVYGFGVALLFTLWPLGRVERVSASMLFRDEVSSERTLPRPWVIVSTLGIALALFAFAALTSDSQRIAIFFAIGLVVVFAVFYALGIAVTWLARRVPRPRYPELSLAIANLGSPGGLTRSVVLSLGAGLSLLVAVSLADASLVRELQQRLPSSSPDYFVLDVPKDDFAAMRGLITRQIPGAVLDEAPMLRGRLVRLNDVPVEEVKAPPEAQWVLNGDRGLSYSDDVPAGSRVVEGEWWPKDYDGEPLVSFEAELAKKLGLKLGDTVTVNVLGRNVTAKITSLREVHWESLAINFVMLFSPNTLRGAPHNLLVTVSLPPGTPLSTEGDAMREVARAYPSMTAIRVKDVLVMVNDVFTKVMTAVRAAGSVTLIAGALVLAGALATAQRRRILEAVILKTLGATRRRILTAHFLEYLILAAVTALFAVGLGALAASIVVTQLMHVPFVFSVGAVALALAVSVGLVFLFGGAGTWAILRAPAVPYLRSE